MRWATAFFAAVGVTLTLLMYSPVTDWLARPLIVAPDPAQTDAIVLLTAWSSIDGQLSDAAIRRTLRAAGLYKAGVAPIVVVCGRNRSEDSGPTARLMADLLIELGVPAADVRVDTAATNTREAALSVARLSAELNWRRLTLVSEAKDMPRALASFRHEGLTALPGADPRWDLRVPSGPARLDQLQGTIHEWAGLVYYWWNGWL